MRVGSSLWRTWPAGLAGYCPAAAATAMASTPAAASGAQILIWFDYSVEHHYRPRPLRLGKQRQRMNRLDVVAREILARMLISRDRHDAVAADRIIRERRRMRETAWLGARAVRYTF